MRTLGHPRDTSASTRGIFGASAVTGDDFTSVFTWGLLPLALGLSSAHMCPLAEILMITLGMSPRREKQHCWLASRVSWRPTGKDAGCDSEAPGVGKENPPL